LTFVFKCIWSNTLILHLVLFHILGHFIIILSITTCFSLLWTLVHSTICIEIIFWLQMIENQCSFVHTFALSLITYLKNPLMVQTMAYWVDIPNLWKTHPCFLTNHVKISWYSLLVFRINKLNMGYYLGY
jgi:hypothetical protein